MRRKTAMCLYDIAHAIELVELAIRERTEEGFLRDPLCQASVERFFTTIGEALVRIRDTEPPVLESITDWQLIIRFRNLLVHGYDQIDGRQVWRTVQEDLPVMKVEIADLLVIAQSLGL